MKIKTQKEFDSLPDSFDELTYVDIYSDETIIIRANRRNGIYRLYNSSSARLYDSSSAVICDSSSAALFNSSSAALFNSSSARLYNSSSAVLYDSSSARLYDSSSARLYNSSSAELYNSSSAKLYNSSFARLFNQSVVRNHSTVTKIKAYENSHIINDLDINFNGEIFDDATVKQVVRNDISFDTWIKRGYVVADGFYDKYISHKVKGEITIYKTDRGYVAKKGETYAHGDTEVEAVLDLRFKTSNRDTSHYKEWKIDDVKGKDELILAYRLITGACKAGVRDFINSKQIPNELSIKQAIAVTRGAYGGEAFKEFFNRK